MTRLGVLGGSFDPVHWGHLHIALLAREAAGLDRVVFVPAARPPHKESRELAPPEHRVALLELALSSEPKTEISRIELEPGGPRYTVATLDALRKLHSEAELAFILGLDNLRDLHQWREPARILDDYEVIAVDRPGLDRETVDPSVRERCRLVGGNPFAISSSAIRNRAARGLSIRHLVPPAVEVYITSRRLYGSG